MQPRPRRGNRLTRQEQSNSRIVIATACFAAVLAIGWAIGSGLLRSSLPPIIGGLEETHIARVQFAPDRQNRCEQFEWDNSATPLIPKGVSRCRDPSPPPEPTDA